MSTRGRRKMDSLSMKVLSFQYRLLLAGHPGFVMAFFKSAARLFHLAVLCIRLLMHNCFSIPESLNLFLAEKSSGSKIAKEKKMKVQLPRYIQCTSRKHEDIAISATLFEYRQRRPIVCHKSPLGNPWCLFHLDPCKSSQPATDRDQEKLGSKSLKVGISLFDNRIISSVTATKHLDFLPHQRQSSIALCHVKATFCSES